ncbi:MAG: hypothetical protein NT062_24075 [Proteobacteria bacterium]|nr:hypothetical protein [Pseudomonadota bacterium]
MRRAVVLLAFLAACPKRPPKERIQLADPVTSYDGDPVQAMKAELADQILLAYQRDESPDVDTATIAAEIGPARIGVGPGDVLISADDFARAPSRWPLFLGPNARAEIRSKRLSIELARDRSAAYVSDELAWRIPACGRTATIPIRVTALYAHDGDRWVQVFEHLSFAHPPAVDPEGLVGKPFKSATAPDRDLVDELSRGVSSDVARQGGIVADDATMIGPVVNDSWEGPSAVASIPALISDDRRVGLVGRDPASSTIAYWVGNFTMQVPGGGRVRVRGTFVFEHRKRAPTTVALDAPEPRRRTLAERAEAAFHAVNPCATDASTCRWTLVQAHVSQAIRDKDLATTVFGASLVQPYVPEQPLGVSCD